MTGDGARAAWTQQEVGRMLSLLRSRIWEAGATQLQVQQQLGWGRTYISQLVTRQKDLHFRHIFSVLDAIGDEGGPAAAASSAVIRSAASCIGSATRWPWRAVINGCRGACRSSAGADGAPGSNRVLAEARREVEEELSRSMDWRVVAS